MPLTNADLKCIDDALEDLKDAVERFKASPNTETLDDVYRATTSIESVCRPHGTAIRVVSNKFAL